MAVTTTDLGKIMLTNGGEYNPNATYEKMTFVLYQNSTYLALQTVTGIEPSNDLVNWQLMAKGFAGSETQIEGYVFVDNEEVIVPEADPALDADKLGGNLPDYYAPQHEISDAYSDAKSYAVGDYCIYLNALYRFTRAKAAGAWDGTAVVPVTMAQEIAAINNNLGGHNYNGDLNDALAAGIYWCTSSGTTNRPTASAGSLWANGNDPFLYASQLFVSAGEPRYFFRSSTNGVWSSWVQLATKSDLPMLETNASRLSVGVNESTGQFWFTVIASSGLWYSLNVGATEIKFMRRATNGTWSTIWTK